MPANATLRSSSARRMMTGLVLVIAAISLSGCIILPEGESTCTDQGPNSGNWPYCAPSQPGGPGPADDPINPGGPGR